MQTYYAIYNIDEDAYWNYLDEWWSIRPTTDCLFLTNDDANGAEVYVHQEEINGNLEIHQLTLTVTSKHPIK